jgi:hypothetical protein
MENISVVNSSSAYASFLYEWDFFSIANLAKFPLEKDCHAHISLLGSTVFLIYLLFFALSINL